MEGRILNDYFIGEQIGTGAHSTVYKACPLRNGGGKGSIFNPKELQDSSFTHAVKINTSLGDNFKDEFDFSRKFSSESRILRHIEVGNFEREEKEKNSPCQYLVSQRMKGTLFCYIHSEKITEDKIRSIFKSLVKSLEEIHSAGYAHMDLKLANVLIDGKEHPIISDLGSSVKFDSGKLLEEAKYYFMGSRRYMAPEILEHGPFDPQKSDIFSLGVCLYMMLTGGFPFKEAKISDKKFKRLTKRDPKAFWVKQRKRLGSFSDDARDLITKMLAPKPSKRISLKEIKQHSWLAESPQNV